MDTPPADPEHAALWQLAGAQVVLQLVKVVLLYEAAIEAKNLATRAAPPPPTYAAPRTLSPRRALCRFRALD